VILSGTIMQFHKQPHCPHKRASFENLHSTAWRWFKRYNMRNNNYSNNRSAKRYPPQLLCIMAASLSWIKVQ